MVHEDRLSSVLSEFARTLGTDFPIQAILDHLVERIVGILSVTGAGVTLISPGETPQYVAASDEAALRFERLQTAVGDGPCLAAYESGEAVAVADLARDGRFPTFAPQAVAAGLAAVFTFPLRDGDTRVGALDLYRDAPGPLDPHELDVAQTLADVAAAYLLNAQARERVEEDLRRHQHSSLHDPLTGLPNRMLLQQRIEHAAQRATRSHTTAAVLFADLDGFKRVNDTYGHAAGDELLIAIAGRLAAAVRPGDTLARVSGDEFVVLCEDLAQTSDVELLAARIGAAFASTFVLAGAEVSLTASIGIAYAGPGEAITNRLVSDADIAMYQAKRAGGADHRVIDLRAAKEARDRNHLQQDFRIAAQAGQLDLAYQPMVRTQDGLVTGVEALLRWTHPERGPVPAATAVKLAEQSGTIGELGLWVLERACRDRARWLADHPDQPLDLSVNVSGRQLRSAGFSASVAGVLEATGMDPTALVLEVTGGCFLDDDESSMRVLSELQARGVRTALDDFGTGYAALSYLRRLPLDMLKVDRCFVADLDSDPSAVAIVEAITSLAHVLGMTVAAEGVESEQQRTQIVTLGCDLAQGYLYAHPMSGAQLSAQLARGPGPALHLPGRGKDVPALPARPA